MRVEEKKEGSPPSTLTHPAKAKRTKVINLDDEAEATEGALFSALAAENN